MKVSGFTFVRNAVSLDYPLVESISSILPICDEFVVAAGDSDDDTTELIRSIKSDKIKIIETKWDPKLFVHGAINAQQTDIALSHCQGDWCFYLQADEVVHEKFFPIILKKMEETLHRPEVEGLFFNYLHFWGSYQTFQRARNWYRREVRVVRNHIGVHSWKSAQGFRREGKKLKVIHSGAQIYHYGWVRDPKLMKRKQIALDSLHHPREWVENHHPDREAPFQYGSLKHLARFKGTHPKVMTERMSRKNWDIVLNPKVKHKHNRLSIRLFTFIEDKILHTRIGEYKNYILID